MLHWLSVNEFECITGFEWLKPLKFDRLVVIGNTTTKMPRPPVEALKLTRYLKYLDNDICGLQLILSNVWLEQF